MDERESSALGRPLPDRLELRSPYLFRHLTAVVMRLPIRRLRRVLIGLALKRAQDAFNRGDVEVIFAAFAPDAEYQPPPRLPGAHPVTGREAAVDFWQAIFLDWKDNRIENLGFVDAGDGKIVRRAALHHVNRSTGELLEYEIVQETQFVGGMVSSQVNR